MEYNKKVIGCSQRSHIAVIKGRIEQVTILVMDVRQPLVMFSFLCGLSSKLP